MSDECRVGILPVEQRCPICGSCTPFLYRCEKCQENVCGHCLNDDDECKECVLHSRKVKG
jgi:hypothetical protein